MLFAAIEQTLSRAFPDTAIYSERVVQGMAKPCFSVLALDASQTGLIGNRYQARWLMTVRYFPQEDGSESSYAKLHEIAQNLYGVLDEVRYQGENELDIYFGERMSHRIEDNVLQFFVYYTFLLKKELPASIRQEQLDITLKVGDRP